MKTNFCIYLIICLLYSTLANAQLQLQYQPCTNCNDVNTINYGSNATFTAIQVASDYGRRGCTGCTKWHKGVDFTAASGDSDLGYHVISLESGTISHILQQGKFKTIIVDGGVNGHKFGYGHIFRDELPGTNGTALGDMVMKYMNAPNQTKVAIILLPITPTSFAYGPVLGSVTYNGITRPVTNQVFAGDAIAPIGDSGGQDSYAAHIHLYALAELYDANNNPLNDPINMDDGRNTKDPLMYITYDEPNYTITINPITLNYTGNTYVKVRCEMNNPGESGSACDMYYSNAVVDLDNVELFIKPIEADNTAYANFKGKKYDSVISDGSRMTTNRYPSPGFPDGNTYDIQDTGNEGDPTHIGIESNFYCDFPYDDYFFTDFPLRIHKNDNYGGNNAKMAPINDLARYPDQKYHLYAEATTVNAVSFPSDPTEILIDNFRPYIKDVLISAQNINIYHAYWE